MLHYLYHLHLVVVVVVVGVAIRHACALQTIESVTERENRLSEMSSFHTFDTMVVQSSDSSKHVVGEASIVICNRDLRKHITMEQGMRESFSEYPPRRRLSKGRGRFSSLMDRG
eukprot:scaffold5885_cov201-Amphora_coffeaeformis.AAC.5